MCVSERSYLSRSYFSKLSVKLRAGFDPGSATTKRTVQTIFFHLTYPLGHGSFLIHLNCFFDDSKQRTGFRFQIMDSDSDDADHKLLWLKVTDLYRFNFNFNINLNFDSSSLIIFKLIQALLALSSILIEKS